MKTIQHQPKLGLVIEDDVEKWVIESLVHKIVARLHLPTEIKLGSIRLGGSPQVLNMIREIVFLLGKGYDPVIVVFNTETTEKQAVSALNKELKEKLVRSRLQSHVRLVPVIPSIESWVLADEIAVQEVAAGRPPPKPFKRTGLTHQEVLQEQLKRRLGGWGFLQKQVEQVARLLEPGRIRPRSPSFAQFERLVREILLSQVAPAQGAEAQPPASP